MRSALKSLIVVSLYFLEQFKGRSQLQLRHSLLLENIFSMVTLRAMEYILSFLLVPYLLRTLDLHSMAQLHLCRELLAILH